MPGSDFFTTKYTFLSGGGEMGKLIREKDWSKTPLGVPESWPQNLRTMVSVMLENPFGMYIAWGKEYTQIYNDAFRPILGISKHPDALGISTRETFAEILPTIEPMFEDVMKGIPIALSDFMVPLDRNGYIENCYFDFSYSPVRNENGEVAGVLVTVLETTQKKKALDELQESEYRFRTMAENSDILIALCDESTKITYFNKAWGNLTGKSVDELIKFGWLDLVHMEDKDRFMDIYLTSFEQRIPFRGEFRILSKEGEYRWLLTQGPPRFRPDGSFAGYISSSIDITDRKKTEEELKENKDQLQFAIDAAELGTFDYNPVTNKFSANPRLKKWFNLLPDVEISLPMALQAIVENDREKVVKAITNSLDHASGGTYDIIYTIRNPDSKKEMILHAKGRAFFNEHKIAYRLNGTLEDITEEHLSRRKIEESEQIIRNMVESSPAGLCVLNSSTLIAEMVNERFLTITSKKSEEIIGKHYWDCFAESRLQYEAALNSVIETGIPYYANEVEYIFVQDGKEEKAYATFVFAPLKNNLGKIIKVAIWSLDNTMQVLALQKIKESEQGVRALVESAPFPIGVYAGKEMRIVLANQSIIDAWGKGNDVIGKLYAEILPELENQHIYNQLDDVFITGKPVHKQNQLVNIVINGELKAHYFNYSFTPLFNADGNIYGVMNTAADVTELNEAKQKVEATLLEIKLFKFMADNAADPFLLLRKDGSIAYLNKSGMKKWGYSEDELKDIRLPDIDAIYTGDRFKDLFNRNQIGAVPPFETLNKNKSGFVYPVEVSIGNVHLDGEQYMFAISRDITERKKAEKDLLNALHKIEDSEKRFRNSVEQAPMGIAIFRGTDYVVELANEAYLVIIDKKAESLISQPFFETHPELEELVKPLFQQVISTGQPFYGNEFPAILKRMDTFEQTYFNMVYHPLKEDTGEITGIMVVATEVTSMVKAKLQLEESEKYFRKLVTQSPIGMTLLKGEKFIIDTANQVLMKNIWGKKEEDVIGKSILEIFPELDNQKYHALLNKVLKSGITHSEKEAIFYVENENETKKFFLDFEYAPLYDPNGNISGIMVTANDVSDKVEARKKIEDAEERLRLATEATGVGTWDLDLEKRSIIHSQRLAVIFGYPESAILTHSQMLSQVHPEDVSILEKALARALLSGIYAYEARIIKPDNTTSWIRTQGRVFIDENNKPVKMLGNLQDITDEKKYQQILEESESKFRLLANALAQQVWLSDPKGILYYFNDTVLNFSGLSQEELLHGGWLNMVHPEEREENIQAWGKSISTGNEFLFEHRFKRYDGVYRWQLSRAIPQRDDLGNIQMWVGSSTDIQEIKEQEQQKDLFISMASHELKTPLTSIKGYVQILQSIQANVEKAFLEKSLGIIHKQVNKLTQLIAELLDVSKIKSVGLDFNMEQFEMSGLIGEVVTEIKHINPQYEISFEGCEKMYVFADRNRIGQVLINFLNNAVKYSPQSKLVKVYCKLHGNRVRISIKDSGIGIDKKDQENIFQRFYRVEGRSEKTFPGFGIGLFISAEIVKRHGGIIQLESELGKGSVFSFEIPVDSTKSIDQESV
jgi:PAS domain S-box-containing protein